MATREGHGTRGAPASAGSTFGETGADRLFHIAGAVAVYLLGYWIVTRVTAARGPAALFNTTLPIDARIPHLPATWPLYWIAYPYVVLGGGGALLRLPTPTYQRAIVSLVAMTLTGAAIQLILPARAPWPAVPAASQQRFHESGWILPYATLPSMHVAYCLLAAAFAGAAWPRRAVRLGGAVVVVLVAISTLTLKEHVVLDALSGLALGGVTVALWHRDIR